MQCPNCHHEQSAVYGTAQIGAMRQRYRLCANCGHRWKSIEEGSEAVRATPRYYDDRQLSIFDILEQLSDD